MCARAARYESRGGGGEPNLALVELSAELGEPVFGEVVRGELEGAGEELQRAAAWKLPAGGEVD